MKTDLYGRPIWWPTYQQMVNDKIKRLIPSGRIKMEPPVIPENPFTNDLLDYSIRYEILMKQFQQSNNQLEKQVREKLEEAGYKFEHASALVHFLKTRCRLIKDQNQLVTMFVDEKPFTQWYDTINTEMDYSDLTNIKATITYGLPPK